MSTNETQTMTASGGGAGQTPVAKEAPTEQQKSQPGVPKRFFEGQTVCNEKNEKGKLCNGHLKQVSPIREESRQHMRGDDLLYKCQTCGALYAGPPLGHVRDPGQRRYVMSEQNAILVAAGGTLPAFRRTETGALVLATETAPPPPAPAKPAAAGASAKPATTAAAKPAAAPSTVAVEPDDETPEQKRARKIAEAAARRATAVPIPGAAGPPPEGETPEQKLARLQAVVAEAKRRKEAAETAGGGEEIAAPPPRTTPAAATTAGTDSSPAADAHRPAAEAQAATGQASAVPLSAATATASPAAGAETVADLATEASTELTPGAPKAEAGPKAAARRAAPTALDDKGMPLPPPHLAPPPGETHEEKIARLSAVVVEAKRRAGKE